MEIDKEAQRRYKETGEEEAARLLFRFLRDTAAGILYRMDRGYMTQDDKTTIEFMMKIFGDSMKDELNRQNIERIEEKYRRLGVPLFTPKQEERQ